MKTCKICLLEKPVEEFGIWTRKDKSIAYKPQCKICIRDKQREYRKNNSVHAKAVDAAFRKRYLQTAKGKLSSRRSAWKKQGIDPDLAETYYLSHHGRCEICNVSSESLCIDHCHTTGKIRGMLCFTCNRALGLLQDDANRLQIAYNYLIAKGYK